jgi:uncharacterized protein
MRVAIIGGGGSGIVTAYLLAGHHEVQLFEKAPILGGNIRTLNRNVKGTALPKGTFIENGVLGFPQSIYPNFHRLMKHLGVGLIDTFAHAGLFLSGSRYFFTPSRAMLQSEGLLGVGRHLFGRGAYGLSLLKFALAAKKRRKEGRSNEIVTHLTAAGSIGEQWIRSVLMLSYSMPYHSTREFPAELGVHTVLGTLNPWASVIRGGVYAYVERILERAGDQMAVHLGARIMAVRRDQRGVEVSFADHEPARFDKVVFATTPDQVLALLSDATPAEQRRFRDWRANQATTIAHSDLSFYENYGRRVFSPVDSFEKADGDFGYNTYMNRCYGINPRTPYSFAYNLEDWIQEDRILEKFTHITPLYSVDAVRHRREVIETNGENHTFHVGAYLGNGLHEGVVVSASAVSELLGGRTV